MAFDGCNENKKENTSQQLQKRGHNFQECIQWWRKTTDFGVVGPAQSRLWSWFGKSTLKFVCPRTIVPQPSRGAFPYGSRTMSARPYAPDGFNHSGLVYGRRVKTKEYPKKSVSKSPLLKPRDLMCGIALKFYNSHTLDSKPCSKECAKNDRELNVTAARTICRLDQWAKTTNDVLGRSDYMIDQSPLICGDIWLLSRYDVTSSEMEVNLVPRGL